MLSPTNMQYVPELSRLWLQELSIENIARELGTTRGIVINITFRLRREAKKAGRMDEFEFWSRRPEKPGLVRELSKLWLEGRSVRYIKRRLNTTVAAINSITYRLRQLAKSEGRQEELEFWSRDYKVHSDTALIPIKIRARR